MTAQQVFVLGCFWGTVCGSGAFILQHHPTRRRIWTPLGFLLVAIANVLVLEGSQLWLAGLLAGAGWIAGQAGSTRRALEFFAQLPVGVEVIWAVLWDMPPPVVYFAIKIRSYQYGYALSKAKFVLQIIPG